MSLAANSPPRTTQSTPSRRRSTSLSPLADMDSEARVTVEERGQLGQNELARQMAIDVDPQQAADRAVHERLVRVFKVGKDGHASPVIGLPIEGG